MDAPQNAEASYSSATRQIGLAATAITLAIATHYASTGNQDAKNLALFVNALAGAATFAYYGWVIRNTHHGRRAAALVFSYLILATISVNALGYLIAHAV